MCQNHGFSLFDQVIFFLKRQVAARADVNDGLLWFGFNKEIHAIIIFAIVFENTHGKENDRKNCDHWHDWIGGQKLDKLAKKRPTVFVFDPFTVSFNLGSSQRH